MTDQKPDAGDNTLPTDNEATPPEAEEVEPASEQTADAEAPADAEADAGRRRGPLSRAPDAADAEADEAEGEATDVLDAEPGKPRRTQM